MMKVIHKGPEKKNGFTLLELLVVIGIIGILVSAGTISYTSAQKRTRDSRRRSDLQSISRALEQYNSANGGSYPGSGSDTDCSGYEAYIVGGQAPIDPKTGAYDFTNSCSADGTAYCVCALLEYTGSGNAYTGGAATGGRSGALCNWTDDGTDKDYFCVQNVQ